MKYNSDKILHLSRSILILMPKKLGATECALKTSNLMSNIRLKIGQEQCNFYQDTETRSAINYENAIRASTRNNVKRSIPMFHIQKHLEGASQRPT